MNDLGPPVRVARLDETGRIQGIEHDAGTRFLEVGLDDTQFEGLSAESIADAIAAGLLFVVPDSEDRPVAFALCEAFPGTLHLHELDVVSEAQGRGLGRRLIDHVVASAKERGLPRVTLTTYRDVPFNAPFYERYGFSVLPEAAWPDWLATIRETEARNGLDQLPRVAMVLDAV